MSKVKEDPLPCPFCGHEVEFPESSQFHGTWYETQCDNCGLASVSLQICDFFPDQRDELHASWSDDNCSYGIEFTDKVRAEAIAMWNKRVPIQETKA
jgi:endogenous inhibitor of DNA gyrase (YacG/DUF329 family)